MSLTDHDLSISMDSFRPLPKDILEMSESDTACQYCGVSYLLLSKYEQMVGHVRGLEAHLAGLQVRSLLPCQRNTPKNVLPF
ncbi:hypothetical protein BDZ88DRAFT_423214 [Geranomyces variabilis]|nr:hypothetical protein BDZ88DRAFT_423214 [Geranomyces variabilis]